MALQTVNVIGAGIFGLWQAYQLARDGLRVRLYEKSDTAFSEASSWMAGAMLAPYCEAEASEQHLIPSALDALKIWQDSPFPLSQRGTLIVAPPRDKVELTAFAKRTLGHERVNKEKLSELEPALADRFEDGLFYPDEAHMAPRPVLEALLEAAFEEGVEVTFDSTAGWSGADIIVDCRGMGAKDELTNLRPVRGEMAVVKLTELALSRPVRLLHPRVPCYIVPWPDGHYMIGATVLESDDHGPVSVRSALELLGAAFAVHPGFGEAKIIELSSGQRPSLPDNMPKISIEGRIIRVNGAYRHGFLLAPLLARDVSAYIREGCTEGAFFDASGD